MNVLTGRAAPRPEWAVGPVNLHAGLAVAALLELLVEMHDVLSAHPSRDTASEFKYVLWGAVSRPLSHCTFQSPLASFTNRTGLCTQDLIQASDHFDRCSHSDHPNTGASRNRAEFTAELLAAKVDYQSRMVVPPPILALFDTARPLVRWFSLGEKKDDASSVSFSFG